MTTSTQQPLTQSISLELTDTSGDGALWALEFQLEPDRELSAVVRTAPSESCDSIRTYRKALSADEAKQVLQWLEQVTTQLS